MRTMACCCVLALCLNGMASLTYAWDRDAAYAAREAALREAIRRAPEDADALVDLAAFYLKPLGEREVAAADGTIRRFQVPLRNERSKRVRDIYAVSWVFRGRPELAKPLLIEALKLRPGHHRAVREMAMMHRMLDDLDAMKPYMEQALRNNPNDLDMCRLYLDHRTALARVLNDQATLLRTPQITYEDRVDGRYRVTRYPSDAERSRAEQLDAQAQDVRRDAIRPLQHLAAALKKDPRVETDPTLASKWRLATAIYLCWIGDYEQSAGTAAAALRLDPTNLDALDFIIDIARSTHTKDLHAKYKAILDRWCGVDSTPEYIEPKTLGPKF